MKKLAWTLLLGVVVGCSQQDLSINPTQLIGTWKGPSTTGNLYTHWTFDIAYLSVKEDSLGTCRPVQNEYNYQFWLEKNVLVMRYVGFTTGLFPIPDARRPVLSITDTKLILDKPRQVLERCQ